MLRSRFLSAALIACALTAASAQKPLAPTPPLGWNSWDAYGFTVDEKDYKANVEVLAGMKQYGWQYAVIDEGWYMRNPLGKDTAEQKYLFDGNGLLLPVASRYPSSAGNSSFKSLSDWVHAQGLKFGIHILRGIPKEVVEKNLPVLDTNFHAIDAADKDATCPWNDANYGVADNPAGQAFYDSMMKRYAEWGVDFIKVDCISDHPYRPTEIRQIAEAIRKTGRPIVLSLSPGPTQLSNADEVAKYAQMWRITDDHWDWWVKQDKKTEYPFALKEEFDRIASWNSHVKPGSWPDPDMLPEGYLGPHPGDGTARQSRYTPDEQRTEFVLWSISRSPLIFGGNLTRLDALSRALMTNRALLDVNQRAFESHPVADLPAGFENARVWIAKTGTPNAPHTFIAFFNRDDKPSTLKTTWSALHLDGARHAATSLLDGRKLPASAAVEVTLPPHAPAIFRLD